MLLCQYEDDVRTLEPLTLTRAAFELRCGQTTLGEKQVRHFGSTPMGPLVRRSLAGLYRPPTLTRQERSSLVFVNARWLPPARHVGPLLESCVGLIGNEIAYVFLQQTPRNPLTDLPEQLHHWGQTLPQREAGGYLVKHPWDLVDHNGEQISHDFEEAGDQFPVPAQIAVVGPRELLAIDPSARIDPMVVFDTTNGPILVAADAVVTAFSRIEGPCAIGAGAHVLGAKIRAGTTIGPECRVGGEVEASILQGYSNKYHDGFLGHSYLGEWVNLGAGTHNSDLRNDYGIISVPLNGVPTATGRAKVGCFIGDHSKTGLGTLLNTGTCIGAFCNVLPAGRYAPKWLPSFTGWWNATLREETDLGQILRTAAVVMGRRGRTLTETHVTIYQELFEQTAAERRRALREADQRPLRRSA